MVLNVLLYLPSCLSPCKCSSFGVNVAHCAVCALLVCVCVCVCGSVAKMDGLGGRAARLGMSE